MPKRKTARAKPLSFEKAGKTAEAKLAGFDTAVKRARAKPRRACKWCAQGDVPRLLDRDGVLCSLSGEPGVLSHAYGDSFWPCPREVLPPARSKKGKR